MCITSNTIRSQIRTIRGGEAQQTDVKISLDLERVGVDVGEGLETGFTAGSSRVHTTLRL